MEYENVCLEALAFTLPEEVVTSAEIEARLAPVYRRLRLHEGRLELITGIAERRFWAPGTLPGDISAVTAEKALRMAYSEWDWFKLTRPLRDFRQLKRVLSRPKHTWHTFKFLATRHLRRIIHTNA